MTDSNARNTARRLFIALDFPAASPALELVRRLEPLGVGFKVGLELHGAEGPDLLRRLRAESPRSPLFLDLKFHDIPATVGRAVAVAARLGVDLLNLHVTGGEAMVREALRCRDELAREADAPPPPRLIGVTVLTSLDGMDLRAVWDLADDGDASSQALRLAERARDWGLDGVVASAREAAAIRAACGSDFLIITPGIRPAGGVAGDQKRVLPPAAALKVGASHLVVGRPVTRAEDPRKACEAILEEMMTA